MSNNPNIERISFEEIQEFKDLNLFELSPENDEYLIVLLAYDAVTKKFGTALLDTNPDSGLAITVANQSSLSKNIEVKTELLSVQKGYIFKKGMSMTQVMSILADPPVPSVLTMDLVSDVFAVNTSYQLDLSYTYEQNQGGVIDLATLAYFKGNTSITSPSSQVFTEEGEVNFSVFVDMAETDIFLARKLEGVKTVRVIHPVFTGYIADGAPSELLNPLLQDVKKDGEIIADFTAPYVAIGNYWFAVHEDNIPVSWVALDSSGKESISNGGPIGSLFTKGDNITYKNSTYSVYVTDHETLFSENVKIKF